MLYKTEALGSIGITVHLQSRGREPGRHWRDLCPPFILCCDLLSIFSTLGVNNSTIG